MLYALCTWGLQYVVSRISVFILHPNLETVLAISSLNLKSPVCRTTWVVGTHEENLSPQTKTSREMINAKYMMWDMDYTLPFGGSKSIITEPGQ